MKIVTKFDETNGWITVKDDGTFYSNPYEEATEEQRQRELRYRLWRRRTIRWIIAALAIGLMLAGMCYGDIFVGAKTSAVFHTTTCRYATTATAYSWPTYEDATAFNRVPCKTCKPVPALVVVEPNAPFDINSPVFGKDIAELSVSVSTHIAEAEKMLAKEPNSVDLMSRIIAWQCWRLSMICGDINEPVMTVSGKLIQVQW